MEEEPGNVATLAIDTSLGVGGGREDEIKRDKADC
jgi:hypothetical protein